jgi:hypothetical protein
MIGVIITIKWLKKYKLLGYSTKHLFLQINISACHQLSGLVIFQNHLMIFPQ